MTRESNKDMYVAAKISVINQELNEIFSTKEIERASFSEALSMLEKNSTKLSLDTSVVSQDFKKNSIGIVEQFTNSYASYVYEKIFKASSQDLKELLTIYYLKYQIHNIIVTLRCIATQDTKDVRTYLIGNKIQKEHCIKATGFNYDEALKYFSTKFKFPKSLLEFNSIDSIMYLETGLYKWYHEELQKFLIEHYNDSIIQKEHKKHIDVLNTKLVKISEEIDNFDMENLFISMGSKKLDQITTKGIELREIEDLQRAFKEEVYKKTKLRGFGTHFMILNFLQKFEIKLQEISKILKEKALN
ncbi:MAG: V-type ATPase subunit [Nanoarchaeota archaeon]|nr:V-type ATPase subunit [Nanoarchaeota archaeon]